MPNVTVRKNGAEYEVTDLTFEQIKELLGVNGYGHHASSSTPSTSQAISNNGRRTPDFEGFLRSTSDRGRVFVSLLKQSPNGIEANALAGKLGFTDARQIGGLTGGGIAKIAKKNGLKVEDIYRMEVTYPDNRRTVKFYPGKLVIALGEQEKPA